MALYILYSIYLLKIQKRRIVIINVLLKEEMGTKMLGKSPCFSSLYNILYIQHLTYKCCVR